MRSYTRVGLLAAVLGAVGCGTGVPADEASPEVLESQEAPLVGGIATSARPEVGRFSRGCTATLFAPRYVLTAAHCLAYPDYRNTALRSGDAFNFTDKTGVFRSYSIDRIHSFATRRYEYTGSGTRTTDIAILRLSAAVPDAQATPASLSTITPFSGDNATLFGFGCTDREPQSGGGYKQYITYTYNNATQALCPGDSGGPAVHGTSTGGGSVWGVNSDYTGSGSFETWTDIFADVAYYKHQIELLMAHWDGTTRQAGIDRPGLDYAGTDIAADPGICERNCAQDGNCRAWSYVAPGVQAPSARCYLKSALADWTANSATVSGEAQPIQVGIDRIGGEYTSFQVPEARAEICLAACARDTNCRAFAYLDASGTGGTPICYLSNTVAAPVSASYASSGVRRDIDVGVDRWGQDYTSFYIGTGDARVCQRHCATASRCKAFAYAPPNGSTQATCWLKQNVPGIGYTYFSSNLTSGVKRGLELNTDRYGGDYSSFTTSTPEPEVCQAACAADTACQAWTYVPPQGTATTATCYLKNSIPAAGFAQNLVSGIKGVEFF